MPTQTPLLLLQKTMVVVEGVSRKLCPETNIWEVSRPVLEDWMKKIKGPESAINRTFELSKDLLERIPDLPNIMDNANTALQMIAEGKLNLNSINKRNFEIEELKLKNLRNNMIIPTPILEIAKFKLNKAHKQRALLNAEMYAIEDAVEPGYLDEVVAP